jgi:hypothetical protein
MSETRERRKGARGAPFFSRLPDRPGGIAFKADASDGDGIVNVVELEKRFTGGQGRVKAKSG